MHLVDAFIQGRHFITTYVSWEPYGEIIIIEHFLKRKDLYL